MTDDPTERKKYRTELPNMVDDSELSVYAFRLYVHIKRVAGANGGACHQGARTMSKICKMSPGQIAKAKKELLDGGWVTRTTEHTNGGEVDVLTPVNLWEQNYAMYARSEPVPEGDHDMIKGDRNTITLPEGDHTVIKGDHTVIERKNHEERTKESVCATHDTPRPRSSSKNKQPQQSALNGFHEHVQIVKQYFGKQTKLTDAQQDLIVEKQLETARWDRNVKAYAQKYSRVNVPAMLDWYDRDDAGKQQVQQRQNGTQSGDYSAIEKARREREEIEREWAQQQGGAR